MLLHELLEGFEQTQVVQVSEAHLSREHRENDVTIVWCLDPRGLEKPADYVRSALDELKSHYENPELINDVGGAYRLCFDGPNKTALLSSIRKSIRAHQKHLPVKRLVLMMHADCAFIKDAELKRRSNEDPTFPKEMFRLALLALWENLAVKMPGIALDVRLIYVDFNCTRELKM